MRFVSELYISLGILLFLSLGGASLAAWSAHQAAFNLERTELAHRQYQSYLALSSHTYQLFKQFGDAMLIGNRDRGEGESALLKKIRGDIANIRSITAREIQLVGEAEYAELDTIARIESQIEELLTQYQTIVMRHAFNEPAREWSTLSEVLDQSVDEEFSQIILLAIEGEAEEVRQVGAETEAKMQRSKNLAALFTVLAIVASAASLWKLLRDVRMPVLALMEGTSVLSRGNLEHRVEISGPLEFKEVARAFNEMATQLRTRESALTEANAVLEQAVAARTEDLERLLDDLKASDANRRRLLADVSHELRTPLTIIHGEADIALRGENKHAEIYREALEKCRSAAAHTARLVDDLLFLARSEIGDTRLALEAVDLAALLPRVVEEYRNIAEKNANVISFDGQVERALVRADPGRIQQVALILLENAMRYGGRNIEVLLTQTSSHYAVTVHDDGPGMTQDEQALVFERLFRGSNSAGRYDSGAGLGLPIARAIVEAHGGTIDLESEQEYGMAVTFNLQHDACRGAVL